MTVPERIARAADHALCWLLFEWEPPLRLLVALFVFSLAVIGHVGVD